MSKPRGRKRTPEQQAAAKLRKQRQRVQTMPTTGVRAQYDHASNAKAVKQRREGERTMERERQ